MYYRPRQAAKLLGISRETLVRWERTKKIPPAKRDYLNYRAYTNENLEEIRKIMGLDILKDPPKKEVEEQCQKPSQL